MSGTWADVASTWADATASWGDTGSATPVQWSRNLDDEWRFDWAADEDEFLMIYAYLGF